MRIELYDGTQLEFPDNTPQEVIAQTAKRITFERKAQATNRQQAQGGATGNQLMQAGIDPTEGNNFFQNAAIGIGKAAFDTGRGVRQLGAEAANKVGLVADETVDRYRRQADENKARDTPLMNTGGGVIGNIAGNVGMALAPGGVLKGASVAARGSQAAPVLSAVGRAALAPKSITGAATMGAALGAVQPVGEDDSRTLNTGIGGAAGAALPGAVRGWQMAKATFAPFHDAGQNKILSDLLRRASGGDATTVTRRLQDAAQPFIGPSPAGMPMRQTMGEIIPGSLPTVADIADNAGVAALQRTASAIDPAITNSYATRAVEQNAARVNLLRGMAGTDGARDMFGAARDATADTLYKKAFKKGISEKAVARVQPAIENLLKNPAIEDAIPIAKRLARYDGIDIGDPKGSLQGLHYVKKALDDMMDKAKTTGVGKIELGKIAQTQTKLLGVMDKMSRHYGNARAEFQAASRPINQMDTAAELASKSINPLTDQMQPAAFARNFSDDAARRATGFRKATLEGTMDNAQLNTLNALKEDLRRSAATQSAGRGAGSDTVQKLAYSNLIDSSGIPTWVQAMRPVQILGNVGSRGADALYGRANAEMANKLAMMLLDPAMAAQVMGQAAPRNPAMANLLRSVATPLLLSAPASINAKKQ